MFKMKVYLQGLDIDTYRTLVENKGDKLLGKRHIKNESWLLTTDGKYKIIDDNYFKGTWVEWKDNKLDTEWEKLNIEYPIVGKGAFIYHKLKENQNKWVLVSKEEPGYNSKLVYKKMNL